MILYAPAKVNMYLRVLGKRPDGYHEIETVFERIALFDKITFCSLKNNEIKISCDNPGVPTGKNGLAYRAARLLKSKFGITKGIGVKIVKRIPIAAGLGGGSSDTACILTGLNRLWKLGLGTDELSGLGKRLGADVPFFIRNFSFAAGKGRGDEITPIRWRKKFFHLLITPPVKLLSGDIYRAHKKKKGKIGTGTYFLAGDLREKIGVCPYFSNDLEKAVLKKAPLVRKLKAALEEMGLTSLVSGSGPSVFSLFMKRKEAVRAKVALKRCFPFVKNKGWKIFIVPTT